MAVIRDNVEHDIYIWFVMHTATAPVTTGPAENWHPGESGEIEITGVYAEGLLPDLSDSEIENLRIALAAEYEINPEARDGDDASGWRDN